MEQRNSFSSATNALNFLFGGNAIMTFESKKTGVRYTFKVTLSDDQKTYFVSLLTGPDNTADYSYVGIIPANAKSDFRLTKKSRMTPDSTPVRAFRWVHDALSHEILPGGVTLWHEGRCGRCKRVLTVPSSVESGFGPECITKIGAAA